MARRGKNGTGQEGEREAIFLGEPVVKYHRTLTTYLNTLLEEGFCLSACVEPEPAPHLLQSVPDMQQELRRPMMLLVAARKAQRKRNASALFSIILQLFSVFPVLFLSRGFSLWTL